MKTSNIILLGGVAVVWAISFTTLSLNMREAKRLKPALQPFVEQLAETTISCIRLTATDNAAFVARDDMPGLTERLHIRLNTIPEVSDFTITGDTLVYSGKQWVRFCTAPVTVIFPDGTVKDFNGAKFVNR